MRKSTVTFARASEDEASELMAVQNLAFADDLRRYGECPACVDDQTVMLEWIRSAILYKMQADGRIIGTIELRERSATHYHLRVLSVHPDWQNSGVGSKALRFIFDQHPNVTKWTLITPKDNARNCHFYEKAGFRRIGDLVHSDVLTLVRYQRGED